MSLHETSEAIADVLRRNGLPAPEQGEIMETAMQKILDALLKFEAIVKVAADHTKICADMISHTMSEIRVNMGLPPL
jgi:hypothetical protein